MDPRFRTGKFEVQNRKVQGPEQEGPMSKVRNREVERPTAHVQLPIHIMCNKYVKKRRNVE